MIKYLGSKRKLIPDILRVIKTLSPSGSALDLFSGTARVGHALKRAGYQVTANDHNTYAHKLAQCYVQADAARWLNAAQHVIAELNRIPGQPGYFTRTFCESSRFFQPHNGARVDAMREAIASMNLPEELEAVVLISLMEAADRVDSTVGLQMAYLKQWAKRSYGHLELRVPEILPGPGRALCQDATAAAASGTYDIAYLDPPYNQHKYRNNYHIWETLVRWDQPEVYGVACKRADCQEYRSAFNSKRNIGGAFADLVDRIDARFVLVSFSDDGYLSKDDILAVLGTGGAEVCALDFAYDRHVGARIGIYNLNGIVTGSPGRTKNIETLFVADRSRSGIVRRLGDAYQLSLPFAS